MRGVMHAIRTGHNARLMHSLLSTGAITLQLHSLGYDGHIRIKTVVFAPAMYHAMLASCALTVDPANFTI